MAHGGSEVYSVFHGPKVLAQGLEVQFLLLLITQTTLLVMAHTTSCHTVLLDLLLHPGIPFNNILQDDKDAWIGRKARTPGGIKTLT